MIINHKIISGPARLLCVCSLSIYSILPLWLFSGGLYYILLVAQQSGVLLDSTQTHNGPHLVSTEFCQKKYEGNMKKERKKRKHQYEYIIHRRLILNRLCCNQTLPQLWCQLDNKRLASPALPHFYRCFFFYDYFSKKKRKEKKRDELWSVARISVAMTNDIVRHLETGPIPQSGWVRGRDRFHVYYISYHIIYNCRGYLQHVAQSIFHLFNGGVPWSWQEYRTGLATELVSIWKAR